MYQANLFENSIYTVLNPDLSAKRVDQPDIAGAALGLRSSGIVDECGLMRGFLESSSQASPWIGYILNPDLSVNAKFELVDTTADDGIFLDFEMSPSAYDVRFGNF